MQLNKILIKWIACILCFFVASCAQTDLIKPLVKEEAELTLADIFKRSKIYLALSISNLHPTGVSSRESTLPAPTFDNNTYGEQNYVDGLLLLFSGTDTATAKLVSASALANGERTFNEPTGISADHILIQQLEADALPASGNLYALILLNANNCFTTTGVTNLTLVGDDSQTNLIGKTFSEVDAYFAGHLTIDENASALTTKADKPYFMMSSAPTVIDGNVQTLVEVTRDHLFPTPTEARQDRQPLIIYVQRLVSKVTVTTTNETLKTKIKGFFLDNTNKVSYLTQHINPLWNARPFYYDDGLQGRYRFAIDPNYDYGSFGTSTETYEVEQSIQQNFNRKASIPTALTALDTPLYCAENTFNLNGMRDNFTTRLVVAYQWADHDFYSIASLDEAHAYTYNEMLGILKQAILDNHKFKEGQDNVNAINKERDPHWVYQTANTSDIVITIAESNGIVRLTDIQLSPAGVEKFKAGPELIITHEDGNQESYADHIMTDVNANTQVTHYTNGICYYPIYIRHFSDEEGKSWELSTPYYKPDHLGRWGMVRNHWYVINLQYKEGTIPQKLGSPTLPTYDNSFDDMASPYFKVTFTVNPWVGRTYEHEFNQ